jgi:hypothetical protein
VASCNILEECSQSDGPSESRGTCATAARVRGKALVSSAPVGWISGGGDHRRGLPRSPRVVRRTRTRPLLKETVRLSQDNVTPTGSEIRMVIAAICLERPGGAVSVPLAQAPVGLKRFGNPGRAGEHRRPTPTTRGSRFRE